MKKNLKNQKQKGEIVTALAVISLGVMVLGALVGSLLVSTRRSAEPTKAKSVATACSQDSDCPSGYACRNGTCECCSFWPGANDTINYWQGGYSCSQNNASQGQEMTPGTCCTPAAQNNWTVCTKPGQGPCKGFPNLWECLSYHQGCCAQQCSGGKTTPTPTFTSTPTPPIITLTPTPTSTPKITPPLTPPITITPTPTPTLTSTPTPTIRITPTITSTPTPTTRITPPLTPPITITPTPTPTLTSTPTPTPQLCCQLEYENKCGAGNGWEQVPGYENRPWSDCENFNFNNGFSYTCNCGETCGRNLGCNPNQTCLYPTPWINPDCNIAAKSLCETKGRDNFRITPVTCQAVPSSRFRVPRPAPADLNGDGIVNSLDWAMALGNYGRTLSRPEGEVVVNALTLSSIITAFGR